MDIRESKGFYKLSWLQRIGFGSGDFAQNLIYQTVAQYISIFYTIVVGLDPLIVGVMVVIPPIINVLGSLALGAFIDKHHPKLGKYRSYLLFGGVPLTAFAILCFWNGVPGGVTATYAFVTYIGLSLFYTVVNVPYGALMASLTRDGDEITKLASTRMFLANLGGLAVGYGIPQVVGFLAPEGVAYNEPGSASAWFITMTIYASVGLALLIFCFAQSKERVVMKAEKAADVKVSHLWRELIDNRPLRVLALFILTAFALMGISNAAGPYYIRFNLGLTDPAYITKVTSWFQGLGSIPAFIFLPLVPAIKKAIGKKQMFYVFLSTAIVGMGLLYIVSIVPALRSQIWIVMVAQFIKSTGIVVATGYMWALTPEVIAFGEHTTSRRIAGIASAIIGVAFQIGLAIGGFIPNAGLRFIGFDSTLAEQTPFAIEGILWLVAVIPIILLFVEMFIISKYELSDPVMDKINKELEERNSK